jgi:hypothetical protein
MVELRTLVCLTYHAGKTCFFEKISKKWLIDCVSLVMSKTDSV